VAPVEEKLAQHRLRWFGHIQQRLAEAPVRSGVIRWTGNERGRGRSNLTREQSVKRDLKDWGITKELALDRREWKLQFMCQNLDILFLLFYCLFVSFFFLFASFHFLVS
jgi:hypothetical protein